MGKVDVGTKVYMSNRERFADIFNYYLYKGENRIRPEDLEELDITELLVDIEGIEIKEKEQKQAKKKQTEIKESYRDILKRLVIKATDECCYILLGLENQTSYDLTMPVRNMLMDAMRYHKQIREIEAEHKRNEKGTTPSLSKEEFLSRFRKEDKLIPIVTLTLYWGEGAWDAPRSLHEMLEVSDESILPYVADYRINLIVPSEMEDFEKLSSDLREVLKVVSVCHSREKMFDLMEHDEAYKSLNKEAAKMIKTCTNLDIPIKEEEESVNMCTAVKEFKQEAVNEGIKVGRAEGRIDLLLEILEEFGTISEELSSKIKQETSSEKMKSWIKLATRVNSLEEFEEKM